MFPDGCSFGSPQHFDPNAGVEEAWEGFTNHTCWEFWVFLLVVLIITFILDPDCYKAWIVVVGSVFVLSVLTKMISITTFGILFSLLYLVDTSLSVNLDCDDTVNLIEYE